MNKRREIPEHELAELEELERLAAELMKRPDSDRPHATTQADAAPAIAQERLSRPRSPR